THRPLAGRERASQERQTLSLRHDFFFSSRRRHTSSKRDWSSDVCSSDLVDSLAKLPAYEAERVDVTIRVPRDVPRGSVVLRGARSEERRVGKEGGLGRTKATDDSTSEERDSLSLRLDGSGPEPRLLRMVC